MRDSSEVFSLLPDGLSFKLPMLSGSQSPVFPTPGDMTPVLATMETHMNDAQTHPDIPTQL